MYILEPCSNGSFRTLTYQNSAPPLLNRTDFCYVSFEFQPQQRISCFALVNDRDTSSSSSFKCKMMFRTPFCIPPTSPELLMCQQICRLQQILHVKYIEGILRQIVRTVFGPDNAYFRLIVSGLQMEISRKLVHWDALLLSTKVYIIILTL